MTGVAFYRREVQGKDSFLFGKKRKLFNTLVESTIMIKICG